MNLECAKPVKSQNVSKSINLLKKKIISNAEFESSRETNGVYRLIHPPG